MTVTVKPGSGRRRQALVALVLLAGCGDQGGDAPTCTPVAGPEIRRQGALTTTGIETDLALLGPGFFAVDRLEGAEATRFLTRDGQFTRDRDGYLVNLHAMRVVGFPADGNGVISGEPGHLLVRGAAMAPRATALVRIQGNLQSDAPVPLAFLDPLFPSTFNFSTAATVYDARGEVHALRTYFYRIGLGTWGFAAYTDGAGIAGGSVGTPVRVADGALTFDAQGRLQRSSQASGFFPARAVGPQPIALDLGDETERGGTGLWGLTQFPSTSVATFVGQDGYGAGELAGVRVDAGGLVDGTFTNGQMRPLGQIAVASVPAPVWLAAHPGHLLTPTLASGEPELGLAGEGERAWVVQGTLEWLGPDAAVCLPAGM